MVLAAVERKPPAARDLYTDAQLHSSPSLLQHGQYDMQEAGRDALFEMHVQHALHRAGAPGSRCHIVPQCDEGPHCLPAEGESTTKHRYVLDRKIWRQTRIKVASTLNPSSAAHHGLVTKCGILYTILACHLRELLPEQRAVQGVLYAKQDAG